MCYLGYKEGGFNLKILNLYAGIGGNRRLWGDEHSITAVEYNPKIAEQYSRLYPLDKLIIGDAKEYLLNNYQDYDFIFASPPCQSHSRARFSAYSESKPVYPDFTLYEIIIFLKTHFCGKYLVENVVPYYEPLIKENYKISRHLIWSNINLQFLTNWKGPSNLQITTCKEFEQMYDIKIPKPKEGKRGFELIRLYRNCVEPKLGLAILNELKRPVVTLEAFR